MYLSKPKAIQFVPPACPVCGKPTYSRGGIHPQCAVDQSDKISRERHKASGEIPVAVPRKLWTKSCPRCRQLLPARRGTCECGHDFHATTKS